MIVRDLSMCFHTEKVEACKDFYTKYFSGIVTFDCGWYVNVSFGEDHANALQFMIPQDKTPLFGENGVTLNFKVDDVDAEYKKLIEETGLVLTSPLQNQPWGDRSFRILDPIGNTLYIYSDREPSEEYKKAYQ